MGSMRVARRAGRKPAIIATTIIAIVGAAEEHIGFGLSLLLAHSGLSSRDDRRIGADPQSQRQDRDHGETK